jgi:hypothetical protein
MLALHGCDAIRSRTNKKNTHIRYKSYEYSMHICKLLDLILQNVVFIYLNHKIMCLCLDYLYARQNKRMKTPTSFFTICKATEQAQLRLLIARPFTIFFINTKMRTNSPMLEKCEKISGHVCVGLLKRLGP